MPFPLSTSTALFHRVPIDAQCIDAPLSRAAIFLVVAVADDHDRLARRHLRRRTGRQPRTGQRIGVAGPRPVHRAPDGAGRPLGQPSPDISSRRAGQLLQHVHRPSARTEPTRPGPFWPRIGVEISASEDG
ncbi:hypothetical protein EH199_20665 [Novosphingobium sp. LASN5T]|nr:hypothetical protein EH199_20665 [Novosphingobium sp. LASN5T]